MEHFHAEACCSVARMTFTIEGVLLTLTVTFFLQMGACACAYGQEGLTTTYVPRYHVCMTVMYLGLC